MCLLHIRTAGAGWLYLTSETKSKAMVYKKNKIKSTNKPYALYILNK